MLLSANPNDEPLIRLPVDISLARRNVYATGRRKYLGRFGARLFHGIRMSFIGMEKKKRMSVVCKCIPLTKVTSSKYFRTCVAPFTVRFRRTGSAPEFTRNGDFIAARSSLCRALEIEDYKLDIRIRPILIFILFILIRPGCTNVSVR